MPCHPKGYTPVIKFLGDAILIILDGSLRGIQLLATVIQLRSEPRSPRALAPCTYQGTQFSATAYHPPCVSSHYSLCHSQDLTSYSHFPDVETEAQRAALPNHTSCQNWPSKPGLRERFPPYTAEPLDA